MMEIVTKCLQAELSVSVMQDNDLSMENHVYVICTMHVCFKDRVVAFMEGPNCT